MTGADTQIGNKNSKFHSDTVNHEESRMGSILTSTHEIQELQAEKVTNHRRMGEEDGILLLGVAKDQQNHIQHHIRIDPIKSRTTAKINNSTRF